ncbi:hypothetical protein CIHG_03903 [Coccidioides immitis H538.4]|uniref:Uncharacterized protein n=3 Tax=Coccidioides immitis TaxID=5501 RepID=A0A0J8QQQ2_COCIT|nr:hypothetical protein CIRG_03655 [Coccidioides immitis RMSCC 2394]KMU74934.1 hypothetical protein CISG_00863 [Coccidioides immitis RMSCC 3703]KMU86115.1 hypothetical protein CIHG_03903 [Coccidioides immitis H538.4]
MDFPDVAQVWYRLYSCREALGTRREDQTAKASAWTSISYYKRTHKDVWRGREDDGIANKEKNLPTIELPLFVPIAKASSCRSGSGPTRCSLLAFVKMWLLSLSGELRVQHITDRVATTRQKRGGNSLCKTTSCTPYSKHTDP